MRQDKGTSDYDVALNAFKDTEIHKVYVQMASFFENFMPQMVDDGLNYEDRVSIYIEPLLILCAQFSEATRKYVNKSKSEENSHNPTTREEVEVESKAIQSLLPLLLAYIKETRLNDTITETGAKEFTPQMWESLTNLIAQTTKKWEKNPEKMQRLVDLSRYEADPQFHMNNLKALLKGFTREPLAKTQETRTVVDQVRSRISTMLDKMPRAAQKPSKQNPAPVGGPSTSTGRHPMPFSRSKALAGKSKPEIAMPDKSMHTLIQTFAKGGHVKDLIAGDILKNAIEAITKDPSYQEMVKTVKDFHKHKAVITNKKDAPPKPDKTTRALVAYVERISQSLEKDPVARLKKSQIKRCINNMKNNPSLMAKLATLAEPKPDTRSSRMVS